MSGETTVIKTW